MLRRTFLHLQGIGPARECKLWQAGCTDWDAFIEFPPPPFEHHLEAIRSADHLFQTGQWDQLSRIIPVPARWRAWAELGRDAVFVDLETDGGIGPENITVIWCHSADGYRAFVQDDDLDEAGHYLSKFPLWITYNGAAFDRPLLLKRFAPMIFNHVHIDLLFACRSIGLCGGLKWIEQRIGLERDATLRGLSGWDAVRLWREWQTGSTLARDQLIAYNQADVEHLRPLMEFVYREKSRIWM